MLRISNNGLKLVYLLLGTTLFFSCFGCSKNELQERVSFAGRDFIMAYHREFPDIVRYELLVCTGDNREVVVSGMTEDSPPIFELAYMTNDIAYATLDGVYVRLCGDQITVFDRLKHDAKNSSQFMDYFYYLMDNDLALESCKIAIYLYKTTGDERAEEYLEDFISNDLSTYTNRVPRIRVNSLETYREYAADLLQERAELKGSA